MYLFTEVPLLGKISRMRRAKSANLRGSAKSKYSDKRKLFSESESSSSDTVVYINLNQPHKVDLDAAEERIRNIKQGMKGEDGGNQEYECIRPKYIDIAIGQNE